MYDNGSLDTDLVHVRQVILWSPRKRRVLEIVRVILKLGSDFGDCAREAVMMDIDSSLASEGSGRLRLDFVRH